VLKIACEGLKSALVLLPADGMLSIFEVLVQRERALCMGHIWPHAYYTHLMMDARALGQSAILFRASLSPLHPHVNGVEGADFGVWDRELCEGAVQNIIGCTP